jgi:hypothetical protein
MPNNDQEVMLVEAFKKMSFEGRAVVIERALLVKRIEDGLRHQYGLTDDPPEEKRSA